MTKINLVTKNPTPKHFKPTKGDVFQVPSSSSNPEPMLVLYTDEDSIVIITGDRSGVIDMDAADYSLTAETLVNHLELTATLDAIK